MEFYVENENQKIMGKYWRVVLILTAGLVGGCSTPHHEELLSFPTIAPSAITKNNSTSLGSTTPDISPPSSISDYISASSTYPHFVHQVQ